VESCAKACSPAAQNHRASIPAGAATTEGNKGVGEAAGFPGSKSGGGATKAPCKWTLSRGFFACATRRAAIVGAANPVRRVGPLLRSNVIQRRIDATFVWPVVRGPQSDLQAIQTFFDNYVASEYQRAKTLYADDDIKETMEASYNAYRTAYLQNEFTLKYYPHDVNSNAVQIKLNDLVARVNAVADQSDQYIEATRPVPFHPPAPVTIGAVPAIQQPEEILRHERKRRAEVKQLLGTTSPRQVRGFSGQTEAHTLLTALQNALTGALGVGFPLEHIGIRGSSVTGVRSRNLQPYEIGTGPYQNASDASDVDFFFTCPQLKAAIERTQHNLSPNRQMGADGVMNYDNLMHWLKLGAATNGYNNSVQLQNALELFALQTQNQIGRKAEPTFLGKPTNVLRADPGTMIF
jgi:hypothetical protein